ncbi:hypothetical protein P2H44_11620 [Albimonas sp. CAU 1670]|uniref:hypothetical protein n=1 Tax=Albimonas sp. CAU 1670 TaxID=3032599 RepID=UPI0023D9CC34|nr:hypothetical protein [Albimonas sp. CAU 1670]MDF2233201.1 hypothetical protein [Albimonas sp. CAU 1670]
MSGSLTARERLLNHPRWLPFFERGVDLEAFSLAELRDADAFYAWVEETGRTDPGVEDILAMDRERVSANRLRRQRKVLERLIGAHPVLERLEEAIRRKDRACDAARRSGRPGKERPGRSVSVPPEDLPPAWRKILDGLALGESVVDMAPPAPSIVKRMDQKLRQLIWSARKAGLPDELSVATARAYYTDLQARGLRPATLRASFEELCRFARHAAMSPDLIEALQRTYNTLGKDERLTPALKHGKVHAIGTTVDVIVKAEALLREAQATQPRRSRRTLENAAAALALFALAPVRLADTALHFGRQLRWDAEGWSLSMHLSKGKNAYGLRFDRRVDPYIDTLILRGADPAWLDDLRDDCLARQRALFLTPAGTPAGPGYVSDLWRRHLGTGEHIARTLIHAQVPTRTAMLMTGQRSERTAKAYQGEEFARQALETAQSAMEAELNELRLDQDEDDDPFA